ALDHALARRRDARQRTPVALEDAEAQLVLELLDLLADGGLRGVKLGGRGGDVQLALRHRGQEPQLLQLHRRGTGTGLPALVLIAARAGRRTPRRRRSVPAAPAPSRPGPGW